MNYNYQQQFTTVLPSIQSMLSGAQVSHCYQKHQDTPLLQKYTNSSYHPKPLEPSMDSMHTIYNRSTGHVRAHSDVTHFVMQPTHHHKRNTSEHTFEYARKLQQPHQPQNIIPNTYHAQKDSNIVTPIEYTIPTYYYSSHRIRLQGQSLNKYICPHCHKRFSRPSSLRTHTYSHTGEKPYICFHPECNRSFSVQSNMRRHMKVHEHFIVQK